MERAPTNEPVELRDVTGSPRRMAWVGLAVLVVALGVFPSIRHVAAGQVLYVVVTCSGALLAWTGAGRWPARQALAWRLVAVGLALSALGDLVYLSYELRELEGPDVSLADVGWIASYLGIGAGLVVLSGGLRNGAREVDAFLEASAVAVVGLLAMWYVSVSGTFADTETPLGVRAVWASYPMLDVWLLALVVRLVIRRGSSTGWLFALGVVAWLASDFAYLLLQASESYSVLLDHGWMLAAVAMGAAAWSGAADTWADRGLPAVSRARMAVVLFPLLVPGLVEIWGSRAGVEPEPVPLFLATGLIVLIVFVRGLRLIAAGEAAQADLASRRRHYRALAANSSDAVLVVDPEGHLKSDPAAASRLLGVDVPAGGSDNLVDVLRPHDPAVVRRLLGRAAKADGATITGEIQVVDGAGNQRWLLARVVDLAGDPDVAGIVCNLTDITSRKLAESRLEHQALHDGLTGLANRTLLRDRMDHALQRARRRDQQIAVVYLDLDRFKTINDSLGHDVGDQLLVAVAERLKHAVREEDTVARLGGDEFALLLEGSNDIAEEAETVCDRILEVLAEPVRLDGRPVLASASLGVVIGDGDATSASLLRDADVALYQAKAAGRRRWVRYEPDMQAVIDERLRLEIDLFDALDRSQFELVYQPVIQLDTDAIVGFEALLRWNHPTLGLVGPDRFIPLAEESGHIVDIGRWVLDTACATLARWTRQYPEAGPLTMAVNISARQLGDEGLVDDVITTLARHQVDPGALVLEMTETALVSDLEAATQQLLDLHDFGVRLAIDDFGTGYSSLGYLRQFPVDILKIDRSFINTITDPTQIPDIVRGLLDLADTLHLATVAEGIEHETQRDLLRSGDCQLGQGYLYSRPLATVDAEALVAGMAVPLSVR